MQIDELLPSSGPAHPSVTQPDDPYIADLLQVADDRCGEETKNTIWNSLPNVYHKDMYV